jgi:hypothetical protein
MDDWGVTWFEEPVSSQDLAGLAAVRAQVRPDVTAGEYSWSLAGSARLIEAGAVDCLQLEVTCCGGGCCSTGFSARPVASSPPIAADRASASSCGTRTRSASGRPAAPPAGPVP